MLPEKIPALDIAPLEVFVTHEAAPPAVEIFCRPVDRVDRCRSERRVIIGAHGAVEIPEGSEFHPLASILVKIAGCGKRITVLGELIQDMVVDP